MPGISDTQGMLEVAGGDRIHWEVCGNPEGKPAVVVHGGPGSGCQPWHRQLFDPQSYHLVLFDQRGCGRSRPHASLPGTSLAQNTTANLIADLERLRKHLQIERWLMLGGSWGSALALAYAQQFPQRVSELVLFGITTGRQEEFDWLFRGGLSRFFPEEWQRLCAGLPQEERGGDIVAGYCRRLQHPDASIRESAARSWCEWESATPNWPPMAGLAARFRDREFAMAFARIVTHYVRHDAWLVDGRILRDVARIAGIPGVLVQGRFDFQAPLANAWALHRCWPGSQLVIVNDAGHAADHAGITGELTRALARFAIDWAQAKGES
jgi:proline iminopeptidase